MKTFIVTIISIVLIFSNNFAQSNCPTISVTGPESITQIGDSMTFTANLVGGSYEKISLEWTVSSGTITKGQGTSTITVATNSDVAGQTIAASVKISGLAETCKNEAAESGEAAPPPPICRLPKTIDDYVKLSWREEMFRLQNLAFELKNDKDSIAYFIVEERGDNRSKILKTREARIKKYLFEQFNIAKDRIIFVDAGKNQNNTRIYLMPKGVEPPQ